RHGAGQGGGKWVHVCKPDTSALPQQPRCDDEGMATLKERLRTDLTAAMKSRDTLRAGTLRMALTAITNAEVGGKQARELTDDEVTAVIGSEAKKRREAAEAFDAGGRTELAQKERD